MTGTLSSCQPSTSSTRACELSAAETWHRRLRGDIWTAPKVFNRGMTLQTMWDHGDVEFHHVQSLVANASAVKAEVENKVRRVGEAVALILSQCGGRRRSTKADIIATATEVLRRKQQQTPVLGKLGSLRNKCPAIASLQPRHLFSTIIVSSDPAGPSVLFPIESLNTSANLHPDRQPESPSPQSWTLNIGPLP